MPLARVGLGSYALAMSTDTAAVHDPSQPDPSQLDPGQHVWNPLEPGYLADPYTQFRELRRHAPVQHHPLGFWAVFRYEDVFAILRDPSLSVDDANVVGDSERAQLYTRLAGDREARGDRAMLNLDPPDHTRLRKLVSKAFTPRRIAELRPEVQRLVDEALDRVAGEGRMDVIADLAFPLPFEVISEMLGMPAADRDQIRDWSGAMVKSLDPIIGEDEVVAALAASDHMTAHLRDVIAWKRANPADDLLSALIAAEDDGDMLTETELVDQVSLLFIAGHETTVNLIGNGTLALLRNRDQLELLRDDPSLDSAAVDELLRYDSPVQASRRITLDDLRIGDVTIDRGSFVMCGLASSNRDEQHWGADADRLDLRRKGAGQHLAFGSGAHHCLGAALARLEGEVAIGSLIRRFPGIELTEADPPYNGRINLRGLERLPVTLG